MSETLIQLNPYGLAEGATCDNIRIQFLGKAGQAQGWDGVVSLPPGVGDGWEAVATQAFLHAKESGGLQAGMMAFCSFSYLDDETNTWTQFM